MGFGHDVPNSPKGLDNEGSSTRQVAVANDAVLTRRVDLLGDGVGFVGGDVGCVL